eukprot:scaffold2573_cov202-Ochromonas_danica.AAC.5
MDGILCATADAIMDDMNEAHHLGLGKDLSQTKTSWASLIIQYMLSKMSQTYSIQELNKEDEEEDDDDQGDGSNEEDERDNSGGEGKEEVVVQPSSSSSSSPLWQHFPNLWSLRSE